MASPSGQQPSSAPQPPMQQPTPPPSPPAVVPGGTQNTPASGQPVQPHAQPPTRWRRLLNILLRSNLVAAVVAAAIGAAMGIFIPRYFDAINQHPSDTIVTHLMGLEAQAGKTHDLGLVRSIYDPNAVVADA